MISSRVVKALAIDAMSGDFGPRVIVPAALKFLQRHSDARIVLVGQQNVLKRFSRHSKSPSNYLCSRR